MEQKRKNGLGKGLRALISDEEIDEREIKSINIKDIYPNKNQPRKNFDEDSLNSLSESIKKYGVLQPIIVKEDENKKFMIIAGERRYKASLIANLDEVPVVIKDISDKDIMELALIENLQREDLSFTEEALAYKNLIDNYNKTQEEISYLVGKSRPHISNIIRLLSLPKEVIDFIDDKKLTISHGKLILGLEDKDNQIEVAKKIVKEELNVRQSEALINKLKNNNKVKKETKAKKDIFIIDVEEKLTNIFKTKVNISSGAKKGKIEIEYYNEDDLNNIVSMLLNES